MLRTRFTEMFDLRAPIMSAPMVLHTGATIAAAVSSAGSSMPRSLCGMGLINETRDKGLMR